MPAYLSPIGNDQFIDVNGNPLNGGKIYAYLAGTSTPAGTWTTSAGIVAQPNPIILNSLGATANPIWLTAGVDYKFVIKDASDVTTLYTFDNITGINDPIVVANPTPEWIASTMALTYVSATVFSAVGDQTITLPIGIRVKTTNTAGMVYGRVNTAVFSAGVTIVTLVNDGAGVLDAGLSALSYSILSPIKPSLPNSQEARDSMGIPNGVSKNLIKNPYFQVNQDVYLGGFLAAGAYGHDCWKAGAAGCTYTATLLGGVTISTGTLVQIIEIPEYIIAGTICVLSGFSGTATVDGFTGTSPFVFTYFGAGTISIILPVGVHDKLQMEVGKVPTSPEYRTYQQDLLECQRFYEIVGSIGASSNGGAGIGYGASRGFAVKKRTTNPVATVITPPSYVNASGFAVLQVSDSGFIYTATATATGGSNYGNATAAVVSFSSRL